MKVVHVISSIGRTQGGTSEVVPRMCEELYKAGCEVRILTCEYGDLSDAAYQAEGRGVAIQVYARTGLMGRTLRYSRDFASNIRSNVEWADIVHLHGLWQWPCWCAAACCRKIGRPYIVMPHGFLEPERLKISSWKKKIVGAFVERRNLKKSNGLVATSQSEAKGFEAYGLNLSTHIMPIGLDLEPIDSGKYDGGLLRRIGCDLSKKHILYFSRITPIKGLDMLCDAWRKVNHKNWQLLIVGPDDRGYAKKMQSLYSSHIRNESVVFCGPIYGLDKYNLLRSVDALVLPTRSENWSIAVAEAMAAGLPIVCTKGAPWSCINEVDAGCWVDVNADAIANGLDFVLDVGDDARKKMGQNGRMWVENNLQWPKIASDMIRFYSNVIGHFYSTE